MTVNSSPQNIRQLLERALARTDWFNEARLGTDWFYGLRAGRAINRLDPHAELSRFRRFFGVNDREAETIPRPENSLSATRTR